LNFCVLDDDLRLLPAAAPRPHAGQQQEVVNPAALVQIPCSWTSAPAVPTAAVVVVVGKVPDFWVTLTKFAVDCEFSADCSDAENNHHQQQVQLVSRIYTSLPHHHHHSFLVDANSVT
jgi:hypothetical protein